MNVDITVLQIPFLTSSGSANLHIVWKYYEDVEINPTINTAAAPTIHTAPAPVVQQLVCTRCNTEGDCLKVCGKCKAVRYCSRQCQVSDWPKHKSVCRAK